MPTAQRRLPSGDQTVLKKEPEAKKSVGFVNHKIDQQPPKRSFFKRLINSFVISLIIILVILVFGITYVAAASGLVNIPGLSQILYKEPQPLRFVEAEDLNSEGIKSRVAKEISKGKDRVEIFITEGNLTSILNGSMVTERKVENAQVAIFDDGKKMEVFGKMAGSHIFLSAVYNINKDFEGNFQIDNIAEFRLGNIKIPHSLISTGMISEDSIKNLTSIAIIEDSLSDDGTGLEILDIEFTEGKVIEFVSLTEDNNVKNMITNDEIIH